jgi:hypothetical protein
MENMRYIHSVEHYSAMKSSELDAQPQEGTSEALWWGREARSEYLQDQLFVLYLLWSVFLFH